MKHTYVTMSGQTIPFINIDYVDAPELKTGSGRWGYYVYFKSHHKIFVGDNYDSKKVTACHDKLTESLALYLETMPKLEIPL